MAWNVYLVDNGVGRQYQAKVTHDAGVTKASDTAAESSDRKTYTCSYTTDKRATGTGPDYFWLPFVNNNHPTGRQVDILAVEGTTERARVTPKPTVRDSGSGGPEDTIAGMKRSEFATLLSKAVLKAMGKKGPKPPILKGTAARVPKRK